MGTPRDDIFILARLHISHQGRPDQWAAKPANWGEPGAIRQAWIQAPFVRGAAGSLNARKHENYTLFKLRSVQSLKQNKQQNIENSEQKELSPWQLCMVAVRDVRDIWRVRQAVAHLGY